MWLGLGLGASSALGGSHRCDPATEPGRCCSVLPSRVFTSLPLWLYNCWLSPFALCSPSCCMVWGSGSSVAASSAGALRSACSTAHCAAHVAEGGTSGASSALLVAISSASGNVALDVVLTRHMQRQWATGACPTQRDAFADMDLGPARMLHPALMHIMILTYILISYGPRSQGGTATTWNDFCLPQQSLAFVEIGFLSHK